MISLKLTLLDISHISDEMRPYQDMSLNLGSEILTPKDPYFVFSDKKYEVWLLSDAEDPLNKIELSVNAEKVTIEDTLLTGDTSNKKYCLLSSKNAQSIFSQCMGNAVLSLTMPDGSVLNSPMLTVLERDQKENDNISAMRYFVLKNQEYLVKNRLSELFNRPLTDNSPENALQLQTAKQVIACYQDALYFFRSNSKRSYEFAEKLEALERVKTVTADTLRYIVTHPDELIATKVASAVVANGQNYMPRRTLSRSLVTTNRYIENQVILNFLFTVYKNLYDAYRIIFLPNPKNQSRDIPSLPGFGQSVYTGFAQAHGESSWERELSECLAILQRLYCEYQTVFTGLTPQILTKPPQLTDKVLSTPVYRRIYALALNWFKHANNDEQQRFCFNTTARNLWYEYYCLLKICEVLYFCGCKLINSSKVNWSYQSRYYTAPSFDNLFEFSLNGTSVQLYYQPVIKNYQQKDKGIKLIRSSSWIMNEDRSTVEQQVLSANAVYTPDFLIKICSPDRREGYCFLDSKYSSLQTVLKHRFLKTVFKYDVQISYADPADENLGVLLLCGKTQEDSSTLHDYDEENTALHHADAFTLNENSGFAYLKQQLELRLKRFLNEP